MMQEKKVKRPLKLGINGYFQLGDDRSSSLPLLGVETEFTLTTKPSKPYPGYRPSNLKTNDESHGTQFWKDGSMVHKRKQGVCESHILKSKRYIDTSDEESNENDLKPRAREKARKIITIDDSSDEFVSNEDAVYVRSAARLPANKAVKIVDSSENSEEVNGAESSESSFHDLWEGQDTSVSTWAPDLDMIAPIEPVVLSSDVDTLNYHKYPKLASLSNCKADTTPNESIPLLTESSRENSLLFITSTNVMEQFRCSKLRLVIAERTGVDEKTLERLIPYANNREANEKPYDYQKKPLSYFQVRSKFI
jgi:hypothetical protein